MLVGVLVAFSKLPNSRFSSCPHSTKTVCFPVGGKVCVHPFCRTSETMYVTIPGTPVHSTTPVVRVAMMFELGSAMLISQPAMSGSPASWNPS